MAAVGTRIRGGEGWAGVDGAQAGDVRFPWARSSSALVSLAGIQPAAAINFSTLRHSAASSPCDTLVYQPDGGYWSWSIYQHGVNPHAVWVMTTAPGAVIDELSGPNGQISQINHAPHNANTDAVFVAW